MVNKILRFIIISLLAACLVLPNATPAAADDGESDVGASVTITEDDTGGGGEGGGGGGGGARGITSFSGSITPEGRLVTDIIAPSSDLRVYLTLPSGTYCLHGVNEPVYWISIKALAADEERPVPAGSTRVMPMYEMNPEGTTFYPSVLCTFKYMDSEVPEGANENDLVIMCWQPATNQWEPLPSQVNPSANTVTTTIGNFSIFTLMLSPRAAAFELSELFISPDEISISEEAIISVLVTNTGSLAGDCDVILRVNYEIVDIKIVTLTSGDSEYVEFRISQGAAGTYTISVNELTTEFTVRPSSAIEPDIEPTPGSVITPEPEQAEITETVTQPEIKPTERTTQETEAAIRWWIFAVLFGIATILGLAFLLVSKRQKS